MLPGVGAEAQLASARPPVADLFAAKLYTGTGAIQAVNAGLDLSGKGGIVWTKSRSALAVPAVFDTARGATKHLNPSATDAEATAANSLTAFTPDGFNLGTDGLVNTSARDYVAWSFLKAAKFLDVVTYAGNAGASRQIAHSLGVQAGLVIIKKLGAVDNFVVLHRSLSANQYMVLNSIASVFTSSVVNAGSITSTYFTVGNDTQVNASGQNYVAYVFAHDTAADGNIQCGSYTGNGSATGPLVSLGWDPQFLLIRNAGGSASYNMFDSARGGLFPAGQEARLIANGGDAETYLQYVDTTGSGFQLKSSGSEVNQSGNTHIYLAVRRG